MSEAVNPAGCGRPPMSQGDREARTAKLLIPATFVAMILSGIWALFVGTASMGGDDSDITTGWPGVARNIPVYLLVFGLGLASIVFAALAIRDGARNGTLILVVAAVVFTLVLSQSTRDVAELVMDTRAATVSWLLFLVDAVVVAAFATLAHRWARRSARVAPH